MIFLLLFIQAISLKPASEIATIQVSKVYKSDDFNFYSSATVVYRDSFFYALDMGNKKVLKIDEEGSVVKQFGGSGGGPGEFLSPRVINATTSFVSIVDASKMSFYDFNGTHVRDVSGYLMLKDFAYDEDKIGIGYRADNNKQYKYEIFNRKLELIQSELSDADRILTSRKQREIKNKKMKSLFIRDGKVYKSFKGEYTFQIEDLKTAKVSSIFNRDYKRVPRGARKTIKLMTYDKTSKEELAKIEAEILKEQIAKYGNYLDDISHIVGAYKNYLVLRTVSPKEEVVTLDFVDLDKNTYSPASITFDDKILRFNLSDDKFVVTLKNDEDGPYFVTLDVTTH